MRSVLRQFREVLVCVLPALLVELLSVLPHFLGHHLKSSAVIVDDLMTLFVGTPDV